MYVLIIKGYRNILLMCNLLNDKQSPRKKNDVQWISCINIGETWLNHQGFAIWIYVYSFDL